MKRIGFWKEYKDVSNVKSIFDESLHKNERPVENPISNYLKNGIRVFSERRILRCVITGETIDVPTIYTDGEWVWTTELIYYYTKYNFELPEEFVDHILDNKFAPPKKEDFEYEELTSFSRRIRVLMQ